jgi:fumarate reductase subunit D
MNVQHAPTAKTESRERHSSPRLQGRWLLLARVVWVALVVLTLAIFFASLPAYLALLQTPCIGPACTNEALLTPEQAGVLKGMGLSLGTYAAYTVALTLASVGLCLVVSTLIVWRRSDDRMAMLVALMLVTFGPISATSTVKVIPFPWQVPNACVYFLAFALLMLVFLLFPTGQFVPRWTRWTLVVFLAVLIPFTFFPNEPFTQNTLALSLLNLTFLGEFAIIAVVQLYRYRRVSSPLQRQQTKWVVYGLSVLCTVIVVGVVLLIVLALSSPSSLSPLLALYVVGDLLLLLIPLSFGFAMLRYRLWDIDIIIRRTLLYGTLTAILTLVYVGLVIGLQALLRGIINQGSSVAIVISTLAIAALSQPLRRQIQAIIDRRFYRRKYDAAKTVAAFSATLRQEVDLEELREHLLTVVQETMQPAHVSLWLRPPEQASNKQATWSSTPPAPKDGEEQ